MLAPLVALLLAQAAATSEVSAPAAALAPLPTVADRFLSARERLLGGQLTEAAAELEAIAADPAAGEYAERAATLAKVARELAARGRFVPFAPRPGPEGATTHDRGGRAELVLFSTLYGAYAAGATVMAADVQNGRVIASLLLAGGGAGLGGSLWLTRSGPISSGRANAIDSAALWSGYNGTLLGVIGDANFRFAAGISLASSAAGLTTAALLTREASPRAGTVAAANSGGIWGLAAGVFIASTYPGEGSLKAVLTTILVTADSGLVLGGWLGEKHAVSRERALLIDAGAVVGILGGLAVFGIVQPDAKEASGALALAGLGAGLGSAIWFTRDWDDGRTERATSLELGPWVAPTRDGRVAWGVAGRF
jgi:hypothetical protein